FLPLARRAARHSGSLSQGMIFRRKFTGPFWSNGVRRATEEWNGFPQAIAINYQRCLSTRSVGGLVLGFGHGTGRDSPPALVWSDSLAGGAGYAGRRGNGA